MGYPTSQDRDDWTKIIKKQQCPFIGKKCIKTRKDNPNTAIGTCSVKYGKEENNVIVCPHRMLERKQIFMDCIHLLQLHTPGNELHIIPEVSIPGGSVDYFLVSTDANHNVVDFVGIEIQTMDTTGTLWSERQKLLTCLNVRNAGDVNNKSFGINWKMTAKTILIQLHHKIGTFENLNKHLVLIAQDCLLDYMKKEFAFSDNVSQNAKTGDSMQFHSYEMHTNNDTNKIVLKNRFSTTSYGLSMLLGLNATSNVAFEEIARQLKSKISHETLLTLN